MSENRIWVAVRDGGSEGYSAPLRAFSSWCLAEAYRAGSSEGGFAQITIFSVPVDDMHELVEKIP